MNNVKKLRTKLHMTQSEFAEYCGISIVSVSRYESGQNISRKNAEKIAGTLKISIDKVLNLNTNPVSEPLNESHFMLTQEEEKLVSDYRRLSHRGQFRLRETLEEMSLIYYAAR